MTVTCPGPDLNPRQPRLRAPAGTTDSHFHIFGPTSRYPFVVDREYTPPDCLPSDWGHLAKTLGVQRAVLIQPSVYGEDNRCMIDSAFQLGVPTRMIVVLPFSTTDKELQQLHDAGARGIRFILAHIGGLPLSDIERFANRIEDMGWHLQFLLRPEHLVELESRLARLPTDFVVDHIGFVSAAGGGLEQPGFQALLRLFRGGHCWAKLTAGYRLSTQAPPYHNMAPFVQALVKEHSDRLIWGTDWPHVMIKGNQVPNTTDVFDTLLDWVPDEKVRNQVLVDNPQKLFSF